MFYTKDRWTLIKREWVENESTHKLESKGRGLKDPVEEVATDLPVDLDYAIQFPKH